MKNCSLIGYGEWGQKIYKTLNSIKKLNIIYVCKQTKIEADDLKLNHKIVYSFRKAINEKVDYVFIATPSETHYEIAKYCLKKNKHIFIEKPVCFKNSEFKELIKIAKKNSLNIHVNYIHIYNNNLKALVKSFQNKKKKNDHYKIKIILGNNKPVRKNTSVLMDWGPHIFSMINFILKKNNYKVIKSQKLISDKNRLKHNISLIIKNKYVQIDALFGNNFNSKRTKIEIICNNNKFIYLDSKNEIIINKNKKIYNHIAKKPLQVSIEDFLQDSKKIIDADLLDNITSELEYLEKKLY